MATFHTSHFLTRAERGMLAARPGQSGADAGLCPGRQRGDRRGGHGSGSGCGGGGSGERGGDRRSSGGWTRPPPAGRLTRIVVPRRLFPKNGVEYFVRALPLILQEMDVEAVLIGDGPERERLEALAGSLGVSDRVDFLGKRAHAEMPGLLSSGDLAVIPSLMEATSVAALEAMACELPVLASQCGRPSRDRGRGGGRSVRSRESGSPGRGGAGLLEEGDLPEWGRGPEEAGGGAMEQRSAGGAASGDLLRTFSSRED